MSAHQVPALSGDWPADHSVSLPLPLTRISAGGFLGERVRRNNTASLSAGLNSPVLAGFAADASGGGWIGADYRRRGAADTDLYKWLEAACYALGGGDQTLADVQQVAETILSAAHPSGFVHTNRSRTEGLNPDSRYELYLAGHLFEAAVAHHRVTGEDALLDVARRWATMLHDAFTAGHPYFDGVPEREHPEAELALVRLFRAMGDERYLSFAADLASRATVTGRVADLRCGPHDRHAVCALYTLCAWAELYLQTGEQRWLEPLLPLLDEMERTRLFIHGGIGIDEIIPSNPWHLPQAGSIAETCASVALMMFARRIHAITGESRWFDLIEHTLYNAFLGALSEDQLAILYFSPLRMLHPGDEGRQDLPGARMRLPKLHRTSCCFPNAWRMLASLPEWIAVETPGALQINLFTDADLRTAVEDVPVNVEMRTGYPADGEIAIEVESRRPVRMRLELRIPRWCESALVQTADEPAQAVDGGSYATADRVWTSGDRMEVSLPMPPRFVISRPEITCNHGQFAIMRGPLLYCIEEHDAGGRELARLVARAESIEVAAEDGPGCLPVLSVEAAELEASGEWPYQSERPQVARSGVARMIPWFARGNRQSRRWTALLPELR